MIGVVEIVFVWLFSLQGLVNSIKLTELRVPAHAAEGGEMLLGCIFDMEDDTLYSIKWYQGPREFYRYVPRNEPPAIYFSAPGITVDMTRSSSEEVTLMNLTRESAGMYRCEVSGETPLFTTVYEEKYIQVHLLPETGPWISGLQDQYNIGDRVFANCTSSASRPETHLKWWINDQLVPRSYLQGPWYRISMDRSDAEETILQLRFTITGKHFRNGVLKLKCQAIIAPIYQKEMVQSLEQEQPQIGSPYHYNKSEFQGFINYFKPPVGNAEDSPSYENMIKDAASAKSRVSLSFTLLSYLLLKLIL